MTSIAVVVCSCLVLVCQEHQNKIQAWQEQVSRPPKKKVKNKVDWKSRISFGLSTCLVLFFLATYMRKVSSALKWPIDSQCPSQNKKPAYPCPSDLYKTYTKPHLRIDTMNVAPPKTPRYAMSCSTLMHLLQNTRL